MSWPSLDIELIKQQARTVGGFLVATGAILFVFGLSAPLKAFMLALSGAMMLGMGSIRATPSGENRKPE